MKLIISPAKKDGGKGGFYPLAGPSRLSGKRPVLMDYIRSLSLSQAKALWSCNESLAGLNYRRFQEMELRRTGAPALLSYDGIQYQYMAPHLFTRPQFEYAETHLRILSGFYGVLRPFDGVLPYRLEMGPDAAPPSAKISTTSGGIPCTRR